MENLSANSFLYVSEFDDKELVKKCVADVTDLLHEYPPVIIYGKVCNQRRCVGFFSNESEGYYYSNQLAKSMPLTPNLEMLMARVNELFSTSFNGILINKYKTGNDYISAHSDDERNLDEHGVVAISYGATRKFRIRNKNTKKLVRDIEMKPYTIIQMGGEFQKEFTHEIPIEKRVKNQRISFTFRKHTHSKLL